MAITFEDAIRKVIKAYWADNELDISSKSEKYSKEYFNSLKEETKEKQNAIKI